MDSLNKEIHETCVQFSDERMERRNKHSDKHELQARKVLGDLLTAMMEDQRRLVMMCCCPAGVHDPLVFVNN